MRTGLLALSLAVAAIAAGGVWAYTSATFAGFVDDRPYCSNMVRLPDGPSGIGLPDKTFPPTCRYGPVPTDRLGPSPVPALATFLLIAGTGAAISIRTVRRTSDARRP